MDDSGTRLVGDLQPSAVVSSVGACSHSHRYAAAAPKLGWTTRGVCVHYPNIAIVRVSSCYFWLDEYRALQIGTNPVVCFVNGFTIRGWPAQRLFMQGENSCLFISLFFTFY
ncbi:hypothetical protein JA9_002210 [Meyerozyma sp. JA9]|nr:hypothetical protein JA9_002210 [Meyerozyma sp. JA9]